MYSSIASMTSHVEHAIAQALVGEVAKEALHHVQPGGTRRREVDVHEARVPAEPARHLIVGVGRVIIANPSRPPG